METAKVWSKRGTCLRKSVGSVIEKEGRIVSVGYTGAPRKQPHCIEKGCIIDEDRGGCIRSIHAETNSICFAARTGVPLEGATMFTTVAPCIDCSKLIVASGITKVFYLEDYRDRRGLQYLRSSGVAVEKLILGGDDFNVLKDS